MAERTTFYFTGAHALPAVMIAMNADAAGLAILAYLALLGVALISALGEERQEPGKPIRIEADEERDSRHKR